MSVVTFVEGRFINVMNCFVCVSINRINQQCFTVVMLCEADCNIVEVGLFNFISELIQLRVVFICICINRINSVISVIIIIITTFVQCTHSMKLDSDVLFCCG